MTGWEGMESIIGSLANRDLILPYFEQSIMADQWPDHYEIKVDSSPYYGRGDGYFHPSTHPLMGERLLYYLFHPDYKGKMIPERRALVNEMWMTMGSAIHAVLQTQMEMAELLRPLTRTEALALQNGDIPCHPDVEVEYVNHERHVRGRIDWIVSHPNGTRIPVEFKTQNSFAFKRQMEPKDEWLAQLNMGMDATGHDFGILLIAERGGNFDMREFHVNKDQELLDGYYAKFDRVRAAIAANEPPKYCCTPYSSTMQKCPARGVCWLAEKAS